MKKKIIYLILGITIVTATVGTISVKFNNNKKDLVTEVEVNTEEEEFTDKIENKETELKAEEKEETVAVVEDNKKETRQETKNVEEIVTKVKQVADVQAPQKQQQEQVTNKPVTEIKNENQSVQLSENFLREVEQQIFKKVNEERTKAGVRGLSYNNTMEKYARNKSLDMGKRGYFDHKDPEGNLITVFMKNDGVSYSAWAENIAYIEGTMDSSTLANSFMNNWMNSQGHRKNILSTSYDSIGIGVCKIGNKIYATQEFYK